MRCSWLAFCFVGTMMLAVSFDAPASAQPGNNLGDGRRDCQTVRTCRFQRGGSYRGCLSSYTCRVCRLVSARCEIGGRAQNCQEMRCTWGG